MKIVLPDLLILYCLSGKRAGDCETEPSKKNLESQHFINPLLVVWPHLNCKKDESTSILEQLTELGW